MGFKLRSGNGPLQFKQMGATPAKQLDSIFGTMPGDQKIKIEDPKKDSGSTVEGVTKQATEGPKTKKEKKKETPKPKGPSTRAEIDAAKEVNALREDALNTPGTREAIASIGTTEGQKKKQGKLDKIAKRQGKVKKIEKKNQKLKDLADKVKTLAENNKDGVNDEKIASLQGKIQGVKSKRDKLVAKGKEKAAKTTKREARLIKEVGMTAKEYEANQAKKAQTWQNDFMRASLTIPKGSDPADVIAFDESVRTRDARDETTKVDNEYKKLLTKTGAEAYDTKQKELLAIQNKQTKNTI